MENTEQAYLDIGGKGGEPSGIDLLGSSHVRSNAARMVAWLDQMGARQIPIDPATVAQINRIATDLGNAKSPRVRNMGAKLAQAALRYNLELALSADKLGRLDSGAPTEHVSHTFEAVFDRQG